MAEYFAAVSSSSIALVSSHWQQMALIILKPLLEVVSPSVPKSIDRSIDRSGSATFYLVAGQSGYYKYLLRCVEDLRPTVRS